MPTHNKNPIEIMQMKVLKQILGVRTQSTNLGVLLELGKSALDLECIKFSVKNWERIRKGDANSLLQHSLFYKKPGYKKLGQQRPKY